MEKPGEALSPAIKRRALVLAFFAALAAAPSAAAAARLSASLGFGGIVVPGRWNPLWVRCEGSPSNASLHVVLKTEGGGEMGIETFPCVDGLRFECPVLIGENLDSISVRLVSSGQILAEEKLPARSRFFPGHVVLVCGEGTDVEHAVGASLYPSEPVKALSLPLADLPSAGLSYDAVSALVLRDPGAVLAPAQRNAMLSWLSGGGRLAVTAVREEGGSVAALLFPDLVRAGGGGIPVSFDTGFGRVSLLGTRAAGHSPADAEWKDILGLVPYDRSGRISAGRVFKTAASSFEKDAEAFRAEVVILVSLALWSGVSIFVSRNRRKSLVPLLGASTVSLLFAAAGSISLDAMMKRESRVSLRLLILPGGGASFVSIAVRDGSGEAFGEGIRVDTVKGISVDFRGVEEGRLAPSESDVVRWNHHLPAPLLSLLPRSRGMLELTGVFGPEHLADSEVPLDALGPLPTPADPDIEVRGRAALVTIASNAVVWRTRKNGRWIDEPSIPSWVGMDAIWIEELRSLAPGRTFLVGRSVMPNLPLSVGGAASREALWAIPLMEARS
jgi:hypothetical protein